MPDIPTLHEAGLTGFATSQWLGLLAPRGTRDEVIQKFHIETAKTLALPEVRERLAQAALQPVGSTPREFAAVIRADVERWGRLAHELGIQPQ
jgi:tripartite-type tricarboxylate transporter receptor subunit TctC